MLEPRLQQPPCQLDRVELWAVRGQVQQAGAGGRDGSHHLGHVMTRPVVEDNTLLGPGNGCRWGIYGEVWWPHVSRGTHSSPLYALHSHQTPSFPPLDPRYTFSGRRSYPLVHVLLGMLFQYHLLYVLPVP